MYEVYNIFDVFDTVIWLEWSLMNLYTKQRISWSQIQTVAAEIGIIIDGRNKGDKSNLMFKSFREMHNLPGASDTTLVSQSQMQYFAVILGLMSWK